MNITAYEAARELFESIRAPLGTVNTKVEKTPSTHRIKVVVDPLYVRLLPTLPKTFKGYKVVVEKRTVALAG